MRLLVRVRVKTHPSDATVLLDGARLGHTPLDIVVPAASGPHVLKLRRRGYAPQSTKIELSSDVVRDVTMVAN
jgi:hypothetical protein